MNRSDALRAISSSDDEDREGRVERLQELNALLPESGLIGFHGGATDLIFEDVKATWIYGSFVGTVITSYVFCIQQLGGILRMYSDASSDRLSGGPSLESLGALAREHSLITVSQQAGLIELSDRGAMYVDISIDEYRPRLEGHFIEVDQHTDDDPLLSDARLALEAAVSLLEFRGG